MLISANPLLLERVPFQRPHRAARIGQEVFGAGAFVYQTYFFERSQRMSIEGTLPFEIYMERGGERLRRVELLLNGRVGYALGHLLPKRPAQAFSAASCRRDLVRDWHVHIDNYGNHLPGYCGGLSLGDCRNLEALVQDGLELDDLPVLGPC